MVFPSLEEYGSDSWWKETSEQLLWEECEIQNHEECSLWHPNIILGEV